jgi:hypothetical protein
MSLNLFYTLEVEQLSEPWKKYSKTLGSYLIQLSTFLGYSYNSLKLSLNIRTAKDLDEPGLPTTKIGINFITHIKIV